MSAKDQIKQIVDYFKREPQLKDKTDGMAEGLLLGAQLADDANELSKGTDASLKALQREYTENGNGAQTTAEITVARDGELVLDDRLKRDFGNVNAQLAQKASKDVVIYVSDYKNALNTWDEAITLALENLKQGTLKFPNEPITISNTVKIDPFNHLGKVIIDLNGSIIHYTGNNWAFKILSNAWKKGEDGWVKNNTIKLKNGVFLGNENALGAVRVENAINHSVEDCLANDFIKGAGFQLYLDYSTNKWQEENTFRDCWANKTKIGFQMFIDPTGLYEGIDPSLSANGISGNHNIWENCRFNAKVSNAIGFDMHGNMTRCLWDSCGGWLDEDGSTNTVMFSFDGWTSGAELRQPWIDFNRTENNCIVFGDGYNYSDLKNKLLISNANAASFLVNNKDIYKVGITQNTFSQPSIVYNESKIEGLFVDDFTKFMVKDGIATVYGTFNMAGEAGTLIKRSRDFGVNRFRKLLSFQITPYSASLEDYNRSDVNAYGLYSLQTDENGLIKGFTAFRRSTVNAGFAFIYKLEFLL